MEYDNAWTDEQRKIFFLGSSKRSNNGLRGIGNDLIDASKAVGISFFGCAVIITAWIVKGVLIGLAFGSVMVVAGELVKWVH